jgi:hypothetical protein
MACSCGCDWPPCRDGCVGPWQFRLWRLLHPVAYHRHRMSMREAAP